jgi:hypothetical protein
MRRLLLLSSLAACGTEYAPASGAQPDAGSTPGDAAYVELTPPTEGFQIRTPDITIAGGQEVTYCYYFHTPNQAETIVKSWQSKMTPGSHHMILYLTGTADMPDGTLDPSGGCGTMGNAANLPVWTYLAQEAEAQAAMPTNDGTGKPVGMAIPPGQAAVMQMHYLNSGDPPITVHVTLNANGYAPNTAYTPAAAFVTYNSKIDIPAGVGMTATAQGACTVSPAQKFFTMSTHAHKQAVETIVRDGATTLVDSNDWEHPLVKTWSDAPFYSFTSGKLGYQCNYVNGGTAEIKAGPSAQTNEMCMAVGYNFPATKATLCLNSTVIP